MVNIISGSRPIIAVSIFFPWHAFLKSHILQKSSISCIWPNDLNFHFITVPLFSNRFVLLPPSCTYLLNLRCSSPGFFAHIAHYHVYHVAHGPFTCFTLLPNSQIIVHTFCSHFCFLKHVFFDPHSCSVGPSFQSIIHFSQCFLRCYLLRYFSHCISVHFTASTSRIYLQRV